MQEIDPKLKGSFFYNCFKDLFLLDPTSNLPISFTVDLNTKLTEEAKTETVAGSSGPYKTTVVYEYTNVRGRICVKLGEAHQKILRIKTRAGGNIRLDQMYGWIFRPAVEPGSPYTQVGNLVQEYLLSKRQELSVK
jgi:hypothetical protein